MEAQFPDEEHDIAREGTAMHDATAMVLDTTHEATCASDLLGYKMPNGVYITEELVEPIQMSLDFTRSLGLPDHEWVIEQFLTADDLPYEGTPDLWHMSADTRVLHIVDHKYGYRPVEAYENWQMICYAHLIIMFLRNGVQPEVIHFHISQPRAWHPSGKHRTWTVTFAELWSYIEKTYQAALLHGGDCKTGPWCYMCSALAHCPAAREAATAALEISSRSILENIPEEALAAELELMDRASQTIKLRKEAIEALAKDYIKSGKVVPGWGTKDNLSNRKLMDHCTVDFMKQFGDAIGVPLVKEQVLPVTQIEDRVKNPELLKQITSRKVTGQKLTRVKAHTVMERMENARSS